MYFLGEGDTCSDVHPQNVKQLRDLGMHLPYPYLHACSLKKAGRGIFEESCKEAVT